MSLNPIDHTAEANRLIARGQTYLDAVTDGFTDEAVDLAGLHFDKAQVHATLAMADSLRAIVQTDIEIDMSNDARLKELRTKLAAPSPAVLRGCSFEDGEGFTCDLVEGHGGSHAGGRDIPSPANVAARVANSMRRAQ